MAPSDLALLDSPNISRELDDSYKPSVNLDELSATERNQLKSISDRAFMAYKRIGCDDVLPVSPDYVASLREAIGHPQSNYMFAKGWMAAETGDFESAEKDWEAGWLHSRKHKDDLGSGVLVEGYRSLTMIQAVPQMQEMAQTGTITDQRSYYAALPTVAEMFLSDYKEAKGYQNLSQLTGYIQEFTLIMLITRASLIHDLQLYAELAPPRQEQNAAQAPEERPRYAWDINVFELDSGNINHVQVKNHVNGSDRRMYKPAITGIKLIGGYNHLDNLVNVSDHIKHRRDKFPLLEQLLLEMKNPDVPIPKIDQVTAELLKQIGRDDLAKRIESSLAA